MVRLSNLLKVTQLIRSPRECPDSYPKMSNAQDQASGPSVTLPLWRTLQSISSCTGKQRNYRVSPDDRARTDGFPRLDVLACPSL